MYGVRDADQMREVRGGDCGIERSVHLYLRMHVLREVHERDESDLPELRRRAHAPPATCGQDCVTYE